MLENPPFAPLPSAALPLDHLALRGAPGAPALVLRDTVLNYDDLRTRVATLASWLKAMVSKVGQGDQGYQGDDIGHPPRIASWAAKAELTCLLPLAAARAGLIHVPINPLLKRAQVAHILADSGASLLIATPARLASLTAADIPAGCVTIAEPAALAAASELGTALPPSAADPETLAAILYTSGSTGHPKGVMLSHANLWLGAQSVAGYLGLTPQDRALAVLPLSFDYGQNQLLSAWYAGASAVPLDYLTARDVVKAVERYAITTLAAVPPLWLQLTELDWPPQTAARLTRLTNSGGAVNPDLVRALRNQFPNARLFPMYGLTEAFRSTYLDPALVDTHPTSIGRAIPHAEILVIDDHGAVTTDDEEGELVHSGPLVAHGYWRDPARTAERFRPAPAASAYGGTAVWSGDRVRRDANGLLYFAGRRDAMIKSSGNRISPQEVEEAALATGLIAEAVALGLPDARLGQALHLIVRMLPPRTGEGDHPQDGGGVLPPHAALTDALAAALARDLPNFMQPRAIHWRPSIPVGPNGKLDRTGLAREIAEAQAQAKDEAA